MTAIFEATRSTGNANISLFFALLLTLPACTKQPPETRTEAAEPRIPQVEVLRLQPSDWQHTIQVYGVIEAAGEVAVAVETAGTVANVLFLEGQRVSNGDLLLELEHDRQDLRVARARATVASAAAALQEAASTLKRRRGLAAKSAVSKELLESGEIALRRAAAAHDDALAALALAKRALADSRVLSPVDGVIDKREVEPGEIVLPGQVLATIQAVDSLRVRSFVAEREVNFLGTGATAKVSSPGVRGRIYDATVESVGVMADPRTGNFPIKLTLGNSDGLLRPGMTARVGLQGLLERDRLLIPDSAVVDRKRRKVVYLAMEQDGGHIAKEVRPLLRAAVGDRIPVVDGLSAGDELIVTGLDYLIDGSPIGVINQKTTNPVADQASKASVVNQAP
jgi:membrane fusion protein (multidrug efflux system)